ncbi:MAG: P-type conjugative transfer protein TrbL [Acidobacteria bacterium]|nr:P-type conjugative transfer protein TrbL [Acidobacteriota bacterium]
MGSTILNDIVRDYESISGSWFGALFPIAQAVFWTLVLIELVWSAIWWAVDREDGLGVVTALVRKVLSIGFFYALLINNDWIRAVIHGFSLAGSTAAGLADLSPSSVFDQGLALATQIFNAPNELGLLESIFPSLVAALCAVIVIAAYAIIAAQLLVALVESYIVIGGGILLLGFSGSRWTKFFSERYLSYVASVGVKLFVLYLIMGVGMTIAARWVRLLGEGGFSPIPLLHVTGGALVFLFLTWHIPSVAGAMMAGAVTLSLADVYYPTMLLGRAGAGGLAVAGAAGSAAWAGGRWGMDQLQKWTSMHTGSAGSTGGFGGRNGSPPTPPGGGPSGPSSSPAAGPAVASPVRSNPSRVEEPARVQGQADARAPAAPANTRQGKNREGNAQIPTPPNTPMPL